MKLDKFLVLIIFSISSLCLFAQNGTVYSSGFYIKKSGEKVNCKVSKERYKIHDELNVLVNGVKETIYPKDCSEVQIGKSTLKSLDLPNDNSTQSHFYFIATKGMYNLYYRNLPPSAETDEEFNFSLDNLIAFVLENNNQRVEILNNDERTLQKLLQNFPQDKVLIDRLMEINYSVERWSTTIREYNKGQRKWKDSY